MGKSMVDSNTRRGQSVLSVLLRRGESWWHRVRQARVARAAGAEPVPARRPSGYACEFDYDTIRELKRSTNG